MAYVCVARACVCVWKYRWSITSRPSSKWMMNEAFESIQQCACVAEANWFKLILFIGHNDWCDYWIYDIYYHNLFICVLQFSRTRNLSRCWVAYGHWLIKAHTTNKLLHTISIVHSSRQINSSIFVWDDVLCGAIEIKLCPFSIYYYKQFCYHIILTLIKIEHVSLGFKKNYVS